MTNVLDYIDWRGDILFTEKGFNEVDNLVFSILAYLKMENIVPSGGFIGIKEALDRYLSSGYDQSSSVNDPLPLLKKAAASERFGNTRIGCYVNEVNAEKQIQFSAVTFLIDDGTAYVAYRGTDNTIVGWREDFNLSFLPETAGQSQAVSYLNGISEKISLSLRVGGHSKGGNFAVYACAFCKKSVRKRIIGIYSNDGPGFNNEVASSKEYLEISNKAVLIIPESSLIGILLSNKSEKKVVKSSASGVQQHNPYSWGVNGAEFQKADSRSASSLFMDETLGKWISTLSDEERAGFTAAVFDSLEASGALTMSQIKKHKLVSYNAIVKAVIGMGREKRHSDFIVSLKKLALAGKDVIWNETKKSFEKAEISREKKKTKLKKTVE